MTLEELEVDVGWSVLWARSQGYRVAPYYPLLDSRDGALCPLEALAGGAMGGPALEKLLALPYGIVFDFTYGADGGTELKGEAVELGRKMARELQEQR